MCTVLLHCIHAPYNNCHANRKLDHGCVWLHHAAHVWLKKKQQLHNTRSAIYSRGQSLPLKPTDAVESTCPSQWHTHTDTTNHA